MLSPIDTRGPVLCAPRGRGPLKPADPIQTRHYSESINTPRLMGHHHPRSDHKNTPLCPDLNMLKKILNGISERSFLNGPVGPPSESGNFMLRKTRKEWIWIQSIDSFVTLERFTKITNCERQSTSLAPKSQTNYNQNCTGSKLYHSNITV